MGIENEPLRLSPHRIDVEPNGQWIIVTAGKSRVRVPHSFQKYMQMADQGATLVKMAQWSRASLTGANRFRNLAWFLSFLYDQGLLIDERAIEFAEALRPDYTWRESIVFEPLFELELFRLKSQKPRSHIQSLAVFAILIFTFLCILLATRFHVAQAYAGWSEIENAWPPLIAFIVVFSLGRSVRAVAQLLLIYLMSTFPAALRLRLEPVSISLSTDDASKASGGAVYVICSAIALLSLTLPLIMVMGRSYFWLSDAATSFVTFFSLLLLLTDLSPFRQSALTEILRAYYGLNHRLAENQQPSVSELKIRRLHIACCVAWILGFGAFLSGFARDVLSLVKHLVHSETSPPQSSQLLSCIVLTLVLLAIFASLIDDIVSGVGDGGGSDRLSIRRMWRRKLRLRTAQSKVDLESLPFLRQMDSKAREVLLKNSMIVTIDPGEVVCRQGDDDRTLYLVLDGRLAVGKRTSSGRRRIITYLESGAVFGEVAFFLGDKRQADVIAAECSRLLAINHDDRIANLDRSRSSELQLRVWFLQALVSSPVFRELPSEALDTLIFSGEKRTYQPGEKIISEGENGDACYFIVQGRASVLQNFKVINHLKGGDAFGEIALLQPELYRTASVKADSEMVVVRVDSEKFWLLLSSHLPLALQIEELANARLSADGKRD
jgi:CRP-like cAMP-binding protein